jgi:hypothetical protein
MVEKATPLPLAARARGGSPETGSATLHKGRWVPRRKAEVVNAIERGLLTAEEACSRYFLSIEELTSWQELLGANGVAGLRVTRVREYRPL